jgi:large conductance mechanosensitive channel
VRTFLREFREFALRSNVVDLAVAVVIGVAFNAVISSLVNDIVMQLIAAVFGKPDFNELVLRIGGTPIRYGKFLTTLVDFLIVALSLFVVIRSFDELQKRTRLRITADAPPKPEETQVALLTEIRDALRERP